MEINGTFQIEREHETAILTPLINLGELEFERIERHSKTILERLASADVRYVVVDCENTAYYGSTALGFFVKLWKRVRHLGGQMVFCNVSPHEREILRLTRMDTLWSICSSRDEALDLVHQHARERLLTLPTTKGD